MNAAKDKIKCEETTGGQGTAPNINALITSLWRRFDQLFDLARNSGWRLARLIASAIAGSSVFCPRPVGRILRKFRFAVASFCPSWKVVAPLALFLLSVCFVVVLRTERSIESSDSSGNEGFSVVGNPVVEKLDFSHVDPEAPKPTSSSPKPASKRRKPPEAKRRNARTSGDFKNASSSRAPAKTKLPWAGYNLMAQFRPWTSGECNNYVVKFGRLKQFKPSALASFPCSGNTWMRRLLEQASGFFTGSVYRDSVLQASGFYGEVADVHDGTIIVTKTHQHGESDVADFVNGSAILLIRNPYKAILSFHNFLFGGHTGFAPSSNFFRKDWGLFLDRAGENWLRTALDWINLSKEMKVKLHVIHYELLSANPQQAVTDALKFLGLTVDVRRINCSLLSPKEKDFKRQQGFLPISASDLFPQPHRGKLEQAIDYLDSILRAEGLAPLPLERYEFHKGAPAPSLKFHKCPGKLVSKDACVNEVEKLNNVLPKFISLFKRYPKDEEELMLMVKSRNL